MKELLADSVFFGVVVSLLSYELGIWVKKRLKFAVFNPILISAVAVIILLLAFDVEYDAYYEGAKYLDYLLTPTTVCLAVPLYEQIALLKKNFAAVMGGIFAGVLTSLVSVLAMSMVFGLNHEQYVTLLPKSITTAIAMGVSEELGGMIPITVAAIMITGIGGNIMAEAVCRLFHITDPVAKGVGIGSASHALGTAKAMELGEIEGSMSSLSIAVAGLMTVVGASVFANFL